MFEKTCGKSAVYNKQHVIFGKTGGNFAVYNKQHIMFEKIGGNFAVYNSTSCLKGFEGNLLSQRHIMSEMKRLGWKMEVQWPGKMKSWQ